MCFRALICLCTLRHNGLWGIVRSPPAISIEWRKPPKIIYLSSVCVSFTVYTHTQVILVGFCKACVLLCCVGSWCRLNWQTVVLNNSEADVLLLPGVWQGHWDPQYHTYTHTHTRPVAVQLLREFWFWFWLATHFVWSVYSWLCVMWPSLHFSDSRKLGNRLFHSIHHTEVK